MPKQPLTYERIVETAIALADRDGLDGATLRRIAKDLGVHVTSLYNHVPTKEAVIDGIVDRLVAEARFPLREVSWEEWVRRFAAGLRAAARRHPGAFEAFHRRPIQGPRAATTFEVALRAFRTSGFSVADAFSAVKTTSLAVLGFLLEETLGLRTLAAGAAALPATDVAGLPVDEFPYLHEARALMEDADTWPFLIESLLGGFRSLLESRPPEGAGARSGRMPSFTGRSG